MKIISVENWEKLEKKQQTIIAELYKIGNVVVKGERMEPGILNATLVKCQPSLQIFSPGGGSLVRFDSST